MCKVNGCTFCPEGIAHHCRLCKAVDDHFTRDCPNKIIVNRLEALLEKYDKTNDLPTVEEAKEISIPWEDFGQNFWFDKGDLGEYFDYFYDLQKLSNGKSMYGPDVRFANNNIELLMNEKWKTFAYVLLHRIKNN
jgi:hypothetical protein